MSIRRLTGIAVFVALAPAQTPSTGPTVSFTATTANVAGAPDAIRIDVLRWSTDAERDQLLAAWNLTPAPGGRGPGGRGAAARGPAPDDDPFLAGNDALVGGAAARGAGGRGGRGGGAAAAPRPTPESSLTAALGRVPTVGYLWSSEVAGYSLHSAVKLAGSDGGERIILITDRRLGASNDLWKPASTNYEFSVIELRSNSKGEGEGKITLTGKVAADSASKTIAPENYNELPLVLKNVKRK